MISSKLGCIGINAGYPQVRFSGLRMWVEPDVKSKEGTPQPPALRRQEAFRVEPEDEAGHVSQPSLYDRLRTSIEESEEPIRTSGSLTRNGPLSDHFERSSAPSPDIRGNERHVHFDETSFLRRHVPGLENPPRETRSEREPEEGRALGRQNREDFENTLAQRRRRERILRDSLQDDLPHKRSSHS